VAPNAGVGPWRRAAEWGAAMFFTGTHTPKLDDKGRLFLPAKFRDLLTEDVMIAPGQEHCLQVWSVAGFQAMTSDLARKSQADKVTRQHIRYLFSNSAQQSPDKQGRITLTQGMRRYAELDRDVLVVGVMDHAEIWDPETWHAQQDGAEENFANLDGPFGFVED
jgi:MraZ protein